MCKEYVFPQIGLLKKGYPHNGSENKKELKKTAKKIRGLFKAYGIHVKVLKMSQGPTVTRFELQPEPGVRINEILRLEDELKLHLATHSIRIEIPVPGKTAIGIEIPNKEMHTVALRDLLELPEYKNPAAELNFALGRDTAGNAVFSDISKLPHLLIAGSTGSGKSVFINTIIMSILLRATPEDVQLVLIDPKIVEHSIYNGIPHLAFPIVTDPYDAIDALRWAIAEMVKRYKMFADVEVRDINSYNNQVRENQDNNTKIIPRIVVIIDELADLMMVSAIEVEDAICKLTQLAGATGIHLIITTQRLSSDVITGLIRANMRSRAAFTTRNGRESRTILECPGAEELLGMGDMLFYPQGYMKPIRIQGAYVSEKEIQDVCDYLRALGLHSPYEQEIELQQKD
jgi:S-DNA-T family DNA segregation ATPase FtsK/SpoIIIE